MGAQDSKQLQEKYHIQKIKLGEGSFGTVWRSIDRTTQEVVAIKAMDVAKMRQKGLTEKDLFREISMLRESRGCENISQLADTFQDDTYYYLALEYCEGGDFGDKLKEKGDCLEEWEAAKWMRQILNAIDFLHARTIIHRDIKPDNFLVGGKIGQPDTLKLSDFGLAMKLENSRTLLTEKCGTPAFMAPEQHQLPRSKGYGLGVDVWAAGVCMWCLLHGGSHPFMDGSALIIPELLQGKPAFRKPSGFWSRSRWSDAVQNLSNLMTNPNSAERPSVRTVLQDEWFRLYPERGSQSRPHEAPAPNQVKRSSSAGDLRELQKVNEDLQNALEKAAQEKNDGERRLRELQEQMQAGIVHHQAPGFFDGLAQNVKDIQAGFKGVFGDRLFTGGRPSDRDQARGRNGNEDRKANHVASPRVEHAARPIQPSRSPEPVGHDAQEFRKVSICKPPIHSPVSAPGPERIVLLQPGQIVKYCSVSLNQTVDAVIQSYSEVDQTYNLDLKQRAPTNRISPPTDATCRWPNGSSIVYESASLTSWVDGVIAGFNEDDKTYDLNTPDGGTLKERALATKIRARVIPSGTPPHGTLGANITPFPQLPPTAHVGDAPNWNFDMPKGPPVGKLENPFPGNLAPANAAQRNDVPRDFTAIQRRASRDFTAVQPWDGASARSRGLTSQQSAGTAGQIHQARAVASDSDPAPGRGDSISDEMPHISLNCDKCARQYWSVSGKSKFCPVCRVGSTETDEFRIPLGTPCSYRQSEHSAWQHGVLDGFFEGGLYIKGPGGHIALTWHEVAPPDQNYPPWPKGSWVIYESASHNAWVPAVVMTVNDDGTYNLNNKQRAQRERIRIRLTPDFAPIDMFGQPLLQPQSQLVRGASKETSMT